MKISTFYNIKYIYILSLVAFGTSDTLLLSELDKNDFEFPIVQSAIMFIGELLCGILLFRKKKPQVKPLRNVNINLTMSFENKTLIERLGKFSCFFAALFDFVDNVMEFYCYSNLKPLGVVILKMLVIFYLILYRKAVMKKKIYKHQILGIIIFVLSTMCALISMGFSEGTFDSSTNILYVAIMFISQFFAALVYITQEEIMWKLNIAPDEINALKGVYGVGICVIVYVPFRYMLGDTSDDLLKPFIALSKGLVALLAFFALVSLFLYNFVLMRALKMTESLAVSTINAARIIIIGAISLFANFRQAVYFPIFQITSGIIMIVGLLIYNEIIILPWFGLKKSAKISLKENLALKEIKEKARAWQYKLDSLEI